MNKTIKKRMFLEKKYSNYCLFFRKPLPEIGNRVVSISPSAYYYHTGIREKGNDSLLFKKLNQKAHFGLRKEIEEEVNEILNINSEDYKILFEVNYFFELKNVILNFNYNEFNDFLIGHNLKRLRKDKYNRTIKLLRRWGEESFKCHFKIEGARKRIHRNLKKIQNVISKI